MVYCFPQLISRFRLFSASLPKQAQLYERKEKGFCPKMNMNTEQQNHPARRKPSTTDIILMLLGVLILIRTPWSNMNSFHYLLFFLYALCLMLRIGNLRKERIYQMAMEKRKAEDAAKAQEANTEEIAANAPEASPGTEDSIPESKGTEE